MQIYQANQEKIERIKILREKNGKTNFSAENEIMNKYTTGISMCL